MTDRRTDILKNVQLSGYHSEKWILMWLNFTHKTSDFKYLRNKSH